VSKKLNTKTSEVKEHSEFGGSKSEQILNCPGSVLLSRGIPNKDNPASMHGTAAHACLEFIIRNHKQLKNPVQRKRILKKALSSSTTIIDSDNVTHVIDWDEEMVDDAIDALAWVKEQLSPNTTVYVESKIDSSSFTTEGQGSTLDIGIAVWSARELIIADYKYGKHAVEVKNNSQLIYYALGMLIKLKAFKKFDRIRLVIIQPRASHKDGHIREHVISVEDAIKWGKKFRKVVKIALKPNAPLKIGDKWCFFCLAKKKCPAMKAKMASKDFPD
jgi:hypothetical protein